MGLEAATYIDDLVATNPVVGDNVGQGDDHIRLIKSTLQATFPNIAGAMTLSHTELNSALLKTGGQMTGALGADAGTVSLPGLYFEGDTATGLYRPGANQIALAISGARAVLFGASGAVTFDGAVTASSTLDVTGAATFGSTVGITGALSLTVPLALTGLSITGGTAETAIALDDVFPLYDTSATANRKMTPVNLLKVLALLTEDSSPDLSADFLLSYDTSATTVKKVKPSALGGLAAASKAEMEAASSTAVAVTPGLAQNHPGMAKAWGFISMSAGTPTLTAGYNCSITDGGVGLVGVTIGTDFSSRNYAIVPGFRYMSSSASAGVRHVGVKHDSAPAAGSFVLAISEEDGNLTDDWEEIYFVCYGDQ